MVQLYVSLGFFMWQQHFAYALVWFRHKKHLVSGPSTNMFGLKIPVLVTINSWRYPEVFVKTPSYVNTIMVADGRLTVQV